MPRKCSHSLTKTLATPMYLHLSPAYVCLIDCLNRHLPCLVQTFFSTPLQLLIRRPIYLVIFPFFSCFQSSRNKKRSSNHTKKNKKEKKKNKF